MKAFLPKVEIWTDGGCAPNPGNGGWGALLLYEGKELELYGRENDTTNNRMELLAVLNALSVLHRPCEVSLYTDSLYVVKGIEERCYMWNKTGWKTQDGSPVLNSDLWKSIFSLVVRHHLKCYWVKGHSGIPNNERVDSLATLGRCYV